MTGDIIFISHKLKEVMEISDRVTVINHGKIIGSRDVPDFPSQLANMMVGRGGACGPWNPQGPAKFKVGSRRRTTGLPALRGIDFNVRAGEILGICGVDGSGQTELVQCITGMRRLSAGKVPSTAGT